MVTLPASHLTNMGMKIIRPKMFMGIAIGVVAIVGALIFSSLPRPDTTSQFPITASQLVRFNSQAEARTVICSKMRGDLFDDACQEKFNNVSKNDSEKIAELFSLVEKIKNDSQLSDYERLLIARLVFAALPTKDSPDGARSSLREKFETAFRLKIAHGEELNDGLAMSDGEFRKLMTDDLRTVVDLRKGDNAWAVQVMVSKYSWVNGERQPIYSDEYLEAYDPFPGISTELKDESKIPFMSVPLWALAQQASQ